MSRPKVVFRGKRALASSTSPVAPYACAKHSKQPASPATYKTPHHLLPLRRGADILTHHASMLNLEIRLRCGRPVVTRVELPGASQFLAFTLTYPLSSATIYHLVPLTHQVLLSSTTPTLQTLRLRPHQIQMPFHRSHPTQTIWESPTPRIHTNKLQ